MIITDKKSLTSDSERLIGIKNYELSPSRQARNKFFNILDPFVDEGLSFRPANLIKPILTVYDEKNFI